MFTRHLYFRLLLAGILFSVMTYSAFGKQASEPSDERLGKIPQSGLAQIRQMIEPDVELSSWRKINWLTDVGKARRQSAEENKPLLIMVAADGSGIGRC